MASKRKVFITSPHGDVVEVKHKNGKTSMKIVWNEGFFKNKNKAFENAQGFVDTECIRRMKPYTPMQTGVLQSSATIGTVIGSGEIHQVAPYAHRLYYGDNFNFNKSKHSNAGPRWFDRMKADHKDSILRGVKKFVGAK